MERTCVQLLAQQGLANKNVLQMRQMGFINDVKGCDNWDQ